LTTSLTYHVFGLHFNRACVVLDIYQNCTLNIMKKGKVGNYYKNEELI